jgi:hypothetical protein
MQSLVLSWATCKPSAVDFTNESSRQVSPEQYGRNVVGLQQRYSVACAPNLDMCYLVNCHPKMSKHYPHTACQQPGAVCNLLHQP